MVKPALDKNTVFLIDGSGYIFRAFFAIRPLRSKAGVPTNAVFGFTNMLLKLLKEHAPNFIGIAFDRKEPTFRHEIYKAYKANRPSPPEDLIPQFDLIHRMVEALNIKVLSMKGFEADDLIATMTMRALEQGRNVVVVTGDKDLMQLVNENTFLLDELRAQKYGEEHFIGFPEVKEEFGVLPHQVADVLALAGDASDNVPGVHGIGKKTAAELVHEFGSVEKVLEMAPLIKQKSRREKIIDQREMALISKRLVILDKDAPISCEISDLHYQGLDKEKFKSLCLELDFNRLLADKSLLGNEVITGHDRSVREKVDNVDTSKYVAITNETELNNLCAQLKSVRKIALDTETDSVDSTTANIVGISLSWGKNEAAYIPLFHSPQAVSQQLALTIVQEKLNAILGDSTKIIVAQNAKFDHKILTRHGFFDFTIGGDPMLENYLLHQDQEKHNLDDLSVKYLDHKPIAFDAVCQKGMTFADVTLDNALTYAAEDADLALRLEGLLHKEIQSNGLEKLYQEIELPLERVLGRMELVGVRIDIDVLSKASQDLNMRLNELVEKAYSSAGCDFNLASPKQVSEVLFEKLKLPHGKKTKTGYSTDSSVLEALAMHHDLPGLLLEHRMLAKLINTYIETLPLLVNKKTGRIHTNYNQFVTATGRLSSSDPNLQNIPVRTAEGRKIRQAFIAKEGYSLISLDYSQVELRILALVSQDPVLLDSFLQNQDVHKRTASEIFDVSQELVTKQQRDAAKTINFGLLYGMGAQRLAQTLKISRKEAQSYLDKYYEKYAGVFRWKNEALSLAQKNYEVRTLFGRKRSLPELGSKNPMEKARGERLAINTPIQGTAADVMKKAMIDTDAYLSKHHKSANLIMQVHDELIIEAPIDEAKAIAYDVAQIMSKGHGLSVDLKVDIGMGHTWADVN